MWLIKYQMMKARQKEAVRGSAPQEQSDWKKPPWAGLNLVV